MPISPQQIAQLTPGAPVQMMGAPVPGTMINPNGLAANSPLGAAASALTGGGGQDALVAALKKARANNLLAGKLVKPTIGAGTAGADMGTPPVQNADATPGPMVA